MNDTELHARLEAQGFIKTFNGGNTHIYVKGDIVVSGADGDLPSAHWYCVALYSGRSIWADIVASLADSSEHDGGEPRDIWADIASIERMAVASRFASILRAELTPAQWDEMLRRNTLPDYAGPICASHDFCDANMTMAEAFRVIMWRDVDCQSDDDSATWSTAWDIAKRDYLTAKGE